ncbi:CBS domain-containing protein [Candidatus Bathyarchaeota archaeon]|jgi:CBS domain-containing protein|nr:CBS domain-containing protein [Candidatus Bathyarchaeota archaeon]
MSLLKEIMSEPVVTVLPSDTVLRCARLMKERNIESLVVAWGEQGVGIITEKDIVRRVVAECLGYDTKVLDVMSKPLITIHADSTTDEAVNKMKDYGIKRLPVEEKGKIIGIVVQSDLIE